MLLVMKQRVAARLKLPEHVGSLSKLQSRRSRQESTKLLTPKQIDKPTKIAGRIVQAVVAENIGWLL